MSGNNEKQDLKLKLKQKLYAKRLSRGTKEQKMEAVDKVCEQLKIDKNDLMKEVEKFRKKKLI